MKCPYRINEIEDLGAYAAGALHPSKRQEFAECYYGDCPYYVPETKIGSLTASEHCRKVNIEAKNAEREKK